MRPPRARWADQQLDELLAHVLRAGVFLSAGIVALGGGLFLAHHGFDHPSYHVFRGEPVLLRSVGGIIETAGSLSGRGLVQLGLLLLIATPIIRVLCSVAGFARQRDWLYVGITLTVLLLLMFSLLGGS